VKSSLAQVGAGASPGLSFLICENRVMALAKLTSPEDGERSREMTGGKRAAFPNTRSHDEWEAAR
jgi:hypothetical protein